MEDLFAIQQEQRAEFGRWLADYTQESFEWFGRQVAHSFGRRYFWDLPPRDRKAFYAQWPPLLVDGSVPPYLAQPGEPDWMLISTEFAREYDRHVEDVGKLLREEIDRADSMA